MKKRCLIGIVGILMLAAHSALADEQLFNGETWMTDLSVSIKFDTRLTRMALPGTHDTGTYGLDGSSPEAKDGQFPSKTAEQMHHDGEIIEDVGIALVAIVPLLVWDPVLAAAVGALGGYMIHEGKKIKGESLLYNMVAGWARTQVYDLVTQFKSGVRYFDLRVEYTGEDYRFVHGLRNVKTTVSETLTLLADALRQPETGMEIVILDFNHLYEDDGHMSVAAAENLITQHILPTFKYSDGSSMLVSKEMELTLLNIWSNSGQVVLLFPDYSGYQDMLKKYDTIIQGNSQRIISHWPNKQDQEALYTYLYDDLATSLFRPEQCFFVTQCILTEDTDMVHDGIYHYIYDKLSHAEMEVLDKVKHLSSKVRHFYDDLEDNKHAPETNADMENPLNQHVASWYNQKTTGQFFWFSNIFLLDQFHDFPPVMSPWFPEATILAWNMNITRYRRPKSLSLCPGSVFPIDATDIGIDEFHEMPRVFFKAKKSSPESSFQEVPGVLAPGDSFPSPRVYAVWDDDTPIRKYDFSMDQKSDLGPYLTGSSAMHFGVSDARISFDDQTQALAFQQQPMLSSPEIHDMTVQEGKGQATMVGRFFGTTPEIYAEYALQENNGETMYRYRRCEIDKNASLKYMDAYQRPMQSCMKVWKEDMSNNGSPKDVGDSELTFFWQPFETNDYFTGYFLVDNGTGVQSYHLDNTVPTASNDGVVTTSNREITIDVLANDTDEDGDRLKVVGVSRPTYGSAFIEDGSFRNVVYVPLEDSSGIDSFLYTVTDGYGGFSSAEVYVKVFSKSR